MTNRLQHENDKRVGRIAPYCHLQFSSYLPCKKDNSGNVLVPKKEEEIL